MKSPHPAQPVSLSAAAARLDEAWSPRVVAALNDYRFKVARLEGEFIEHAHPDTDEAFLVLSGELTIELPDRAVALGPGCSCDIDPKNNSNPAATAATQPIITRVDVLNRVSARSRTARASARCSDNSSMSPGECAARNAVASSASG